MKFELDKYHRNIPSEEFLADLKKVARKIGKNSVTQKEYNKHGKFNSSTIRRRFGSWFSALEKSGLKRTRNLKLSEKDLLEDLCRVAQLLKKDNITHIEYESHGKFSSNPFIRVFGAWFKALDKAGLKRTRNLGISDEELFENLEQVWRILGRQPHYNDIRKPLSKYSAGCYEYRFGTWRKALEKFIEYVNTEVKGQKKINANDVGTIEHSPVIKNRQKTKRNISWRLRFVVMRRDNFKCTICGRSPASDQKIILHVDHIVPYSKGGETILNNLQTLCSVCNIGKSDLLSR